MDLSSIIVDFCYNKTHFKGERMSNKLKAVFIAFVAVTLMFGCKGPPRPGWHRKPAPAPAQKAQTDNEKAQAAAQKAQDKLDEE